MADIGEDNFKLNSTYEWIGKEHITGNLPKNNDGNLLIFLFHTLKKNEATKEQDAKLNNRSR